MIYIVCRDQDDFRGACAARNVIPSLEATPVLRPYQLVGVNGRGNQFLATPMSFQNPHIRLLRVLVDEIQARARFEEDIDDDLRHGGVVPGRP